MKTKQESSKSSYAWQLGPPLEAVTRVLQAVGQKLVSVGTPTLAGGLASLSLVGIAQMIYGLILWRRVDNDQYAYDRQVMRRPVRLAFMNGVFATINVTLMIWAFQLGAGLLERTVVVVSIAFVVGAVLGHWLHHETNQITLRSAVASLLFLLSAWAVLKFPLEFGTWTPWVMLTLIAGITTGVINEHFKSLTVKDAEGKSLSAAAVQIYSAVPKLVGGMVGVTLIVSLVSWSSIATYFSSPYFVVGGLLSGVMIASMGAVRLWTHRASENATLIMVQMIVYGGFVALSALIGLIFFGEEAYWQQLVAVLFFVVALFLQFNKPE